MTKSKFLLMSVALLALSSFQLHAAKELKLAARYNYSPDGQLQSVLTPVSDNGAVKTSYSRSYISDGKIKVSVHKKNLEFNELAFAPSFNGQGQIRTDEGPLVASRGDRVTRSQSEILSASHDYQEKFASYQVASKGDVAPPELDKGILVREYTEKAGRKLEETDMLGNTNKYYYNGKGQLTKIASLNEVNEVSNGQGRTLVAPADDSETSFFYDKLGRLAKTEDALGRVSGRVYDPEGRVAEMINPLEGKSLMNYDKYGRVVSKSGVGTYPLSFEYNSFGEIIASTDGNGSKTQFEYDNSGRLARRIWPDGTPVSYSYNDCGLLSKKLEGDRTTVHSYDTMNRLIKIEITQSKTALSGRQSSTTLLSYSSDGKLISIVDESGKIEFTYDAFGRITSEKGAVGEIRYEYNNCGLLSTQECSFSRKDAETQSFKTTYNYDNFDRITQVASPAGTYNYTYDSKGRIASLSFGDVTIKNDYDKAGRLISKTFSDSSRVSRALCSYEYDKLDRRVKAEVNGVKWVYGYDEYNQLTSASSSDGYIYGYGFDKIGNRTSFLHEGTKPLSYKYNSLNQICSVSSAQSADSLFAYDVYGNLIKTPDAEYTYDLHNRLCEVRKGDLTVKYSYDPLGQRIKTEEINAKDAKIIQFLMSGMVEQARMELAPSDSSITNSQFVIRNLQFHTLGLDIAQSLTATGGVGAVLASTTYNFSLSLGEGQGEGVMSQHYLYDGNGNVISACDSKGEIIAKLAYSPFGLPYVALAKEGEKLSGADLPFTFSTKPVDASGFVYYGYRYYSPELGRWLSRDPISNKDFFLRNNITKNDKQLKKDSNETTYLFVFNAPTISYDFIGLSIFCSNTSVDVTLSPGSRQSSTFPCNDTAKKVAAANAFMNSLLPSGTTIPACSGCCLFGGTCTQTGLYSSGTGDAVIRLNSDDSKACYYSISTTSTFTVTMGKYCECI